MERTRTAMPRMMSETKYSIGMATGIVRGGAAFGGGMLGWLGLFGEGV